MLPKKIKNHSSSFLVSSKVARFVGSAASASKAKKKAKSVSAIARSVLSDDVPTRSVAPVFCSPPLGFSAKFGSVPDIPALLGALIAAPATESAAPAMESPALVVNSTVKAGSSSPRSDVATAGVNPLPHLPIGASFYMPAVISQSVTPAPKVPLLIPAQTAPPRNYASVLKNSSELQELGTPTDHVSGVPFVLIPDENIETAKEEFKDFLYVSFHGDVPPMGRIIGVVNAVWAKSGPRIYVHRLGKGSFLLRVTNPKTRETLLSRSCWNITGLSMFVAPWSPDFAPDEAPITSAVVPAELRNVPYLLYNNESLSRLTTVVGRPVSVAPETQRKENFQVAKLYVKVDLLKRLPDTIVSGFSNGREFRIDVSYPWLPIKCEHCGKYGHKKEECHVEIAAGFLNQNSAPPNQRKRSMSRPARSRTAKPIFGSQTYVPKAASVQVIEAPMTGPVSEDSEKLDTSVNPIPEVTENLEMLEESVAISKGTGVDGKMIALDQSLELDEGEVSPVPYQDSITADSTSNIGEPVSADQDEEGFSTPARKKTSHLGGSNMHPQAVTASVHVGNCSNSFDVLSDDQVVDDPFFLVNNRKSGRKATKN